MLSQSIFKKPKLGSPSWPGNTYCVADPQMMQM